MLRFHATKSFQQASPRARLAKAADAAKLLDQQARTLHVAWNRYVGGLRRDPRLEAFIADRDLVRLDQLVFTHVANFANVFAAVFTDAAAATVAQLAPRLLVRKAQPTVGVSFDPTDPAAVALMQRNRLNFITRLGNEQRTIIRAALVRGMQEGAGPVALARTFRDSIGLTDQGQRALDTFEQQQLRARVQEFELPEADRGPVFSDAHIDLLVDRKRDQLLQARAEVISRTESLRIVGQAQEEALRQSLAQTGMDPKFTGKEWQATDDGRTREAHSARNGARRRLDDVFAPGVKQPGDGGAAESINCRCSLTYEFFDDEASLQAWLQGGN